MSHSDSELTFNRKINRRASVQRDDLEEPFNPPYPDIEVGLKLLSLKQDSTVDSSPSSTQLGSSSIEDTNSSSYSLSEIHDSVPPKDSLIAGFSNKNDIKDLDPIQKHDFKDSMHLNSLQYSSNLKEQECYEDQDSYKYDDPRGCLFIAGYPNLPNEEDLLETLWIEFSKWGTVDNIKLTKTTSGVPYGFVYFKHYMCAESFLEYSDKVFIDGCLLRVEDARVNRSLHVIYIPNSHCSPSFIYNKLKEYGPIENLIFEEGTKCFGYEGVYLVRFCSWDDAIKAYRDTLNDPDWILEWGTRVGQSGTVGDYCLAYVDGLNSDIVSKSHLIELFHMVGAIKSVNFINRGSASFAFIEFLNPLSSFRAVRCFNNTIWMNQHIHVHHYRRPPAV